MLHQVNQRRGEGGGARPFPGGEFEDEKGIGIQLNEVATENCGYVLDENGACSVDPVWCDKDVDTAKADYSLSRQH